MPFRLFNRKPRIIKKTPRLESFPDGISFLQRINYRITYYIQNDGGFGKGAGLTRAANYLSEINEPVYQDGNLYTDGPQNDSNLVNKVFNDVTENYGNGPFGTSMKLRMHVLEALCEHLGMCKLAFGKALDAGIRKITSTGAIVTIGTISDATIFAAYHFLLPGLYREKYRKEPAPLVSTLPNDIEMNVIMPERKRHAG